MFYNLYKRGKRKGYYRGKKTYNINEFRVILYIYINSITIRGAYKKEALI